MTTAVPSAALAMIQPVFTDPERLALAGFLAGYRGLTREAYALDLRQFTTWCRTRVSVLTTVSVTSGTGPPGARRRRGMMPARPAATARRWSSWR